MKNKFAQLKNALKVYIDYSARLLEQGLVLPPISIPELYRLKKTHQDLLMGYGQIISRSSCLPLFVSPVRKPRPGKKSGSFIRLITLTFISTNPIRLITLRPMVMLLIEFHIHRKLTELEIAYKQLKYTLPANYYDKGNFLVWLEQAKSECLELKATVSSGKLITDTLKLVYIPVGGLLIALFGVSSIYDLVIKLVSTILSVQYTSLVINLGVLALLIILFGWFFIQNTFYAKRSIFLNAGSDSTSGSIYFLENNVFDLIGRRKSKEFALDNFVSVINYLVPMAFFSWIAVEIDKIATKPSDGINFNCLWAFVLMIGMALIVEIIIPWINRYASKEL